MENNAIKIHSHRRRHRNKDKPPRCLRCRVIPGKQTEIHTQDTHHTGFVVGVGYKFFTLFYFIRRFALERKPATKTATTTLWLRSRVTLNRSECVFVTIFFCLLFFLFFGPLGWIIQRQSACHLPHFHFPLAPSSLWLELEFETTAGACKNVCKMPRRCT